MAKGFLLTNPAQPDLFGGANSGWGGMDVAVNSSGHIVTLTGRERVRHDVLKGLLTGKSGTYGTNLPSLIGQKREAAFNLLAASSAIAFLDNYRDAQAPNLPEEEQIEVIRSLDVNDSGFDNTTSILTVVLDMADGQSIEIEHRF